MSADFAMMLWGYFAGAATVLIWKAASEPSKDETDQPNANTTYLLGSKVRRPLTRRKRSPSENQR